MEKTDFTAVPLNENKKNPCSPESEGINWTGIKINLPKKVEYTSFGNNDFHGAFVIIPVCGYKRLTIDPDNNPPMQLFAVDRKTGETFSGYIVELDTSPDMPPPFLPESKEKKAPVTIGSYFNINLANYIKLPDASAKYTVYILRQEIKSNEAVVELVKIERKAKK